MLSKFKDLLPQLLDKLPTVKIRGNLWLVYAAILLLFGSIILYIGTWIWFCFGLRSAGLADLKEIILVLCGAPFVAALTMLRSSAVDTDGDGIADIDQERKEGDNK